MKLHLYQSIVIALLILILIVLMVTYSTVRSTHVLISGINKDIEFVTPAE